MTVFEELTRRGLIAQMTHPEKIEELLNGEKVTFYIGFDATADSLHVGHFLQMVVMKRLQQAGHRPIALLGTGTTMVGDPTGKTDMRKMLSVEEINHNAMCFKRQMEKFIDFSVGKALMLKNGDWLLHLNYIELLRDVGVHFSVNEMLTAECFKTRLEKGLSFIEFNYMIMQSYDFLKLHRDYGCMMQLGGNDQWANILGGIKLTRRVTGDDVYGMTFTLLTTKEGKKMGKTENGAVWLDPEKTSPYEFFQYWRNVADDDVINCLKLLTFVPIEEIEAMEKWEGSQLNKAKEILAHELTKMVHGQQEADKALEAARAIFAGGTHSDDMPTTSLVSSDLADGAISVADLLVKTGLAPSKGEAKRLIQQGGVSVDDVKVSDFAAVIGKESFDKGQVILKKGKKIYHKVLLG
ncbi:tyrosine--tRNA ligase [Anaerotruncus colihominis]|uniref:Tyrosine--tRNA ligase n=1 Tax=Anaerotruncus colihominis TaxID=169435 RepID=A0A3E3IS10_9FIRM|nr:tyrosine--tRNA ligase [Anaerotruncus colihominis]OUO69125.1 tyrosine--tRNA ligase [Anaerotruncus colihominis]RGE69854.1 tyrosine--tRNA ligase [Anaerotruncus colihominis]